VVNLLEETNFHFGDFTLNIDQNRDWMHEPVKDALKARFMDCFPDFDDLHNGVPEEDLDADFFRQLVPVTDQNDGDACIVDANGGVQTDYDLLMQQVDYIDVLNNWYRQVDQQNVCVRDDMFLSFMIENGDDTCLKI